MERRAASTESSQRDQDVKSEEVRRHESIREYKDVDRPLVLITQEQQNKNKNKNSKRRRRKKEKGKKKLLEVEKKKEKNNGTSGNFIPRLANLKLNENLKILCG